MDLVPNNLQRKNVPALKMQWLKILAFFSAAAAATFSVFLNECLEPVFAPGLFLKHFC